MLYAEIYIQQAACWTVFICVKKKLIKNIWNRKNYLQQIASSKPVQVVWLHVARNLMHVKIEDCVYVQGTIKEVAGV